LSTRMGVANIVITWLVEMIGSHQMRKIALTISFTDDDGKKREESYIVEPSYAPDTAGEHRVAHMLLSDLRVMVGGQNEPKHNATAWKWREFPGRPSGLEDYFDIRNSQALWFELATLVAGAEGDLTLAQAYKALEPPGEPPFDDDLAVSDLYYIHNRKMELLNQAVQSLVKVQDLVNRLIHECLGGELVDTRKPKWEKTLTRENVEKQLASRLSAQKISQADYDAITQALEIPKNISKAETAQDYRNRLMHHMRPSVDYSMFFSALESRAGEEIRDAQGKVIGRRHLLLAKQPVEYRFHDLLIANSNISIQ
jgi:hypothetical protein